MYKVVNDIFFVPKPVMIICRIRSGNLMIFHYINLLISILFDGLYFHFIFLATECNKNNVDISYE